MNINNIPRLSIVMPFFNQKEMVEEMINSILANDFQNWELLAIDDGSTQETIGYLHHFTNDSRIRIVHRDREPKGAQTCRNIGLNMAKGDYIVFFDSDDYIPPYCLKQRIAQIEARPELDFMVFPSGSYNNNTFSEEGSYIFGYRKYEDDLKAFIQRTLPFTVWTNIYRTEALRHHEMVWDTNILSLQDSDFNIQALLHGLCYRYAEAKPDYGYRTIGNTSSISKKIANNTQINSHLYFLNKQYTEIQRVYASKYNKDLYRFALLVYTSMQYDGFNYSFARRIAEIVYCHDKYRGFSLYCKVKLSSILTTFLPSKLARQIPLPLFLIRKKWKEIKTKHH